MVKLTGFSSVAAAGQESAIGEEDPYYFTMVADEGPSNASVLSAGRDALPSKKPQESEGLLRWKAPETLVYGKCTTKSDVWYVLYVQAYMDNALHIYHVETIVVANIDPSTHPP